MNISLVLGGIAIALSVAHIIWPHNALIGAAGILLGAAVILR